MVIRSMLIVACVTAVLAPAAALGAGSPDQQLAEKYAPVVGLKQHEPCADTGEPYRPVPAETVLGLSGVVLLGPDGSVVARDGDVLPLVPPGARLHACSVAVVLPADGAATVMTLVADPVLNGKGRA